MSGLRRKDHVDEKLGALNPNISLPDNIAIQILDSPYFTRLLGNDLAEAHSNVEEKKDDVRVVERHAAENNVPLQELRALVESMRPAPDLRPSEGQAEHEARAAQLNIGRNWNSRKLASRVSISSSKRFKRPSRRFSSSTDRRWQGSRHNSRRPNGGTNVTL